MVDKPGWASNEAEYADGVTNNIGEDGFIPALSSIQATIELILKATEMAGYQPEGEVPLASGPASTSLRVSTS